MEHDLSIVGSIGIITVETRGPGGPGEVMVKIRGGSEAYLAWSDRPIPRGTKVLVTEARGARTLEVVPWAETSMPPTGSCE
jgi:hypothetical protein